MPASASAPAIACRVAWRMFVLARWPRTSRWLACAGRISRPETSPFSGVAGNFSSFSPIISPPPSRRHPGGRDAPRSSSSCRRAARVREPEPLVELGQVPAGEERHQQVSWLRTAGDDEQGPDDPCADPAALPFGADDDVLQVGEGRPVAEHHPGADDTLVPDGDHAESGSGEGLRSPIGPLIPGPSDRPEESLELLGCRQPLDDRDACRRLTSGGCGSVRAALPEPQAVPGGGADGVLAQAPWLHLERRADRGAIAAGGGGGGGDPPPRGRAAPGARRPPPPP